MGTRPFLLRNSEFTGSNAVTKRILTLLSFVLLSALTGWGAPARSKVLLILTDDPGYDDLSMHGSPHWKTPAMDHIGREGVVLEGQDATVPKAYQGKGIDYNFPVETE